MKDLPCPPDTWNHDRSFADISLHDRITQQFSVILRVNYGAKLFKGSVSRRSDTLEEIRC